MSVIPKCGRYHMEVYPLVCPFCDELAYPAKGEKRTILPNKIYILRECNMGHRFYSVEEVPEDQSAIVEELREIQKDARKWKSEVLRAKRANRGRGESGEGQKEKTD